MDAVIDKAAEVIANATGERSLASVDELEPELRYALALEKTVASPVAR